MLANVCLCWCGEGSRTRPRSSKARPIPTMTSSCRQTLCSVKLCLRWLGMSTNRGRAEKLGLRDSCYCFIGHRFLCFGCEHVEMSNTEDPAQETATNPVLCQALSAMARDVYR